MAETKKDALAAFDSFVETWSVKYGNATIRHRTVRSLDTRRTVSFCLNPSRREGRASKGSQTIAGN
jgi:uncharacterized protein YijF (DUF1287 family)